MKKCTHCGREYGDDVTVCPEDGATLQAPEAPAPIPPARHAAGGATGLAVTSLVLGILSFVLCLGPLLGIPAIICGHIALGRTKKNPAQFGGRRMSIAGLVIGYSGIVLISILGLAAVLFRPMFAKAKEKAEEFACAGELEQVDSAMRVWAQNHNGLMPANLLEMTNELSTPNLLICPADHHRHGSGSRAVQVWDPDNVTYEFLTPGVAASSVQTNAVVRCPIHGTEVWGDGTLMLSNFPARIQTRKVPATTNSIPTAPK